MPFVLPELVIKEEKPEKVICLICGSLLSDLQSLRRHQKRKHPNHAPYNKYECAVCALTTNSIKSLQTHMDIQHKCSQPQCCFYCNKFFLDKNLFMKHMNRMHGLPMSHLTNEQTDRESYIKPTHTAFGGALKSYDIEVGDYEIDLLSLMRSKQPEIDDIIQLNTQHAQQKVMFIATIQLIKPSDQIEVNNQPDRTNFYAATRMHTVDFSGLSNDEFIGMVEQMLISLTNFASHGSGWTVDRISHLEIRFSKTKPIVKCSSVLKTF